MSRRRPAVPRELAPCTPTGDLAAPKETGGCCPAGHLYRCSAPLGITGQACDALLRRVPDGRGEDWVHVDADGNSWVSLPRRVRCSDGTVIELHTAADYDRLADVDPGLYSILGYYEGATLPWTHAHRPGGCTDPRSPHPGPPVPSCHDRPMWHAPGRWQCRETGTRFPYRARP